MYSCTKTTCGDGGNCRWTSQCSGTTQSNLCPGPADFKCCLPGGSGTYPDPKIPSVGSCKATAVAGAKTIVNHFPGKVREIGCIRDCSCPGTSDHCCGMATDMMCSDKAGVSHSEAPSLLPKADDIQDQDVRRRANCRVGHEQSQIVEGQVRHLGPADLGNRFGCGQRLVQMDQNGR